MNVLFVADHLKFGGAERHLVAVATGMAQRGHPVDVAYLKAHDELAGELRAGGVRHLNCCESRGGIDIRALRRLAAIIRSQKPACIVATSQYSLACAVVARWMAGSDARLLFICHSMEHVRRGVSDRRRFAVYRHFYRRADHVVFVSDLQREFFGSLGVRARSNEVIHNGIDIQRFAPDVVRAEALALRQSLGMARDELVVGMCAAFREEKRQVDLLEAVARLRQAGLGARAVLVGDGLMRAQIEARRDALGLRDAVSLCGFQQDVRPFVAACDVMALTSHAETFPIATLEYMALGKPLVASNVGGLAEQVRDGYNGVLYPAGDITALVDGLTRLTDAGVRAEMAKSARAEVVARFSLGAMIDRFEHTLLGLAGRAAA